MSETNQQTGGADRRSSPRSPIVVREARCIGGMEVFFGYAANVSRGGLFIATPKLRHAGEIYTIEFTLPGIDHTFRCRARVMWTRHYRHGTHESPGFGLQFLDLPEEDAQRIDEWVGASLED